MTILKGRIFMKYLGSFVVLLMAANACGGSSSLKMGEADETSRRNAVQASVQTADTARSASQSQQNSFPRQSTYTYKESSSSESNIASESFSGQCEKNGSVSGKLNVEQLKSVNNNIVALNFEAKLNDCQDDEESRINGDLKMRIVVIGSQVELTMNGDLQVLAKNAKGEFAPHRLSFNNLYMVLVEDQSANELDMSRSLNAGNFYCTGSLTIDGVKKDCKTALFEAEGMEVPADDSDDSDDSNLPPGYWDEFNSDDEDFWSESSSN
jgi:hypothetical protein